jgi:hypothetical protein
MQRPPNSETLTKDPLPSVQYDPTESEIDAAANLIIFGSPRFAANRAAPQKVPRVPQPASRKQPRLQQPSGKKVPKRTGLNNGAKKSPAKKRSMPLAKARKQSMPAPPGPATPRKNKPTSVGDVATEIMATVGSPSPQRSPVKLANGLAAYVCHSMVDRIGPKYFIPEYLAMENYPKNCANCTKKLLPGARKTSDENDGITRVNGRREVKMCQNALNHRDHDCVHCLCFDCHSLENVSKGRPTRKRVVNSGAKSNPRKRCKNGPRKGHESGPK